MTTKAYTYGVEILNEEEVWAIFDAAHQGDVSRVMALLEHEPRLVNAQCWYQFPIHRAVECGHTEIVRIFLDGGADPGQSRYTYDSWDKLLLSAREKQYSEIESLLLQTMVQRFNYRPDFDVLQTAIISRDRNSIQTVIDQHPHLVTASDALGNNPLHWCVITRQLDWIKRFAELGTPVDALRADGHSPVLLAAAGATDYWYRETRGRSHPTLRDTSVLTGCLLSLGAEYTVSVAAAIGDQERIEHLIQKDAALAGQLDSSRVSPLSRASRAGYLHIVQLLLRHGANPNLPEECAPDGRALYEACCANHFEVARLLLEHGANPNAGVDSCECCLTITEIFHGERAKPIQSLLRDYGAYWPPYRMDTEQLKQSIRDRSPATQHEEFLRCVMQNCDVELFELLLNSDETVIARLETGDELTCLKDEALLRHLLERGLDTTRRDWRGRRLVDVFRENGNDALENAIRDLRDQSNCHTAEPE